MSESQKHHSIGFHIGFNWPAGKISFGGITSESISTQAGNFKYLVLTKRYEDKFYNSYEEKPLAIEEINKHISKGDYLMGDIFIIEIYKGEGRKDILKKIKLDAQSRHPKHAIGPTHVDSSYFIEF